MNKTKTILQLYADEIKQCTRTIKHTKAKRKHLRKMFAEESDRQFNKYHGVGERGSLIDHDSLSCFGPPEEF